MPVAAGGSGRLFGPDAGSQLVYVTVGVNLRLIPETPVVVYADPAATILADIATYNGTDIPGPSIPGSTVITDANSLLPYFWFPGDGSTKLWVRGNNGPIWPVNADYASRLDAILTLGGGNVTSVNGFTGAVTLGYAAVGADAAGAAAAAQTAAQSYAGGLLGATPAMVFYSTGTSSWPVRTTVTTSGTRPVVWVGPTAPTIGGSYAVDGLDMWFRTTT